MQQVVDLQSDQTFQKLRVQLLAISQNQEGAGFSSTTRFPPSSQLIAWDGATGSFECVL